MISEPSEQPFIDTRTNNINRFLTGLWYHSPITFMKFVNAITETEVFKWNLITKGVQECRQSISSKESIKTLYFANIHFDLFMIADKKRIDDDKALYEYINFFVNNLYNGFPRILIFVADKDYERTFVRLENIKAKITKPKTDYEVHVVKWSRYLKSQKLYKETVCNLI